MSYTVLFVDDEPEVTNALKRTLRKEPYHVMTATSADEALETLKNEKVDVVVSDEQMPGMSGAQFLSIVKQKYPSTIRMILTGHDNLRSAITAINEGRIYRFLTKPCNDMVLVIAIRQALEQKELMEKAYQLLQASKRQANIIEKMKQEHSGSVDIERDNDGAIVIESSIEELDPEKLIREITEQTSKMW